MTMQSKTPEEIEAERAAFQSSTVNALRSLADNIEAGRLQAASMELENEVHLHGFTHLLGELTGAQVLSVRFRPHTGERS